MKINKISLLAIIFLLLVTGCSSEQPSPAESSEMPLPLSVSFQVEPMLLKTEEVATIQVEVKQGDEPVEDADQVEFEIWKENQEKHDMVPAENKGKGVYSIMERFHEPGIYFIMYHVTARDQHTMKEMQVVVEGDQQPSPATEAPKQEVGHHHHGTAIHFMSEQEVKANQETTFTAHIQTEDKQPLSGGKVQFEYWKGEEAKHVFVDAEEKEAGLYTAKITLPDAGEYQVKTHLEKGEIHDHITTPLVVK